MKTRTRTRMRVRAQERITDNGLVCLAVCVYFHMYVRVSAYSLSNGHIDVPVQGARDWHGLCLMPKQSTKLPRCPLLQMRGERNLIGLSARDELPAWPGRKATANCQLLCTRVARCHAMRLLADYVRNARSARCIQRAQSVAFVLWHVPASVNSHIIDRVLAL